MEERTEYKEDTDQKEAAGSDTVERRVIKPCPFCGGEGAVLVEDDEFQIIGCRDKSMLCPNPSLAVYKVDGEWNYKYWNKRAL